MCDSAEWFSTLARKSPRSVELAAFAEGLLGPLWVSQLARLTGVQAWTIQRIREAAKDGREHPKAQAVADAFAGVLQAAVVDAERLQTVRPNRTRHKRAKAGPGRSLSQAERDALDRCIVHDD